MEPDTADGIIAALDTLLDKERATLLSGDPDGISALLDEKSGLIDALDALQPEKQPELDRLKDKILRNQALLDGAQQGIRKVADRLAALRRMRHSFDTYDESGRRQTIDGHVVHRIEKRA